MAGSGREALKEGWEGLRGPPGGPSVVGRPSQRAGSGWKALPEGRERLGCPAGAQRVVGRPTWIVKGPSWRAGVVKRYFCRAGRG